MLRSWSAGVLLAACAAAAAAAAPDYTAEESAWLAGKPVVRYAIDPHWAPLEYLEGGKPAGLSVEFLKEISHRTGIRFEFVPTRSWTESVQKFKSGEVQILPGTTARRMLLDAVGPRLSTYPYYSGSTTVVSRGERSMVIEPQSLAGLRVAVARDGEIRRWLEEKVSAATLLPFETPQQMLDAVVAGSADVAVAPEIVLLPQMRRTYRGQLNSAGTLTQLPFEMSLAVRPELGLMRGVLEKSVQRLTALQTDQIFDRWLDDADFGRPSVAALAHYYWMPAAFALLACALLAAASMAALRSRRRALRAEDDKSRFLAVMSHEIRTAMNAIVGPVDVLWRMPVSPEQSELLNTARLGSQMLMHTVNNLLDLSKLQSGAVQLNVQATRIRACVDDIADMVSALAREKHLWLQVTADDDIEVMIDSPRYRQVLLNLVSNGLKFTQRGGVSIHVRLDRHSMPWQLQTRVSDTGIGIEAGELSGLFNDYAQAAGGQAVNPNGTGLGLAICKEIVQGMGGRIMAHSTVGTGTSVRFELPVQAVAADAHVPAAPGREAHGPGLLVGPMAAAARCVLVIDDNEINRQVLADQLKLLGYGSRLCGSGPAGLTAWREQPYLAVLLDCQMPGMDGYQVSRIMRSEEQERHLEPTVILALSARSESVHTIACFDAGMNGVLTKPLDTEVLGNTLRMWAGPQEAGALDTPEPSLVQPASMEALFYRSCRQDMSAMRAALYQQSVDQLAAHAHRIKGAALSLKKSDVAQLAGYIETAQARTDDDWSTLARQVDRLDGLIASR
jgi:two-component system sensor histidine kinase EvgS